MQPPSLGSSTKLLRWVEGRREFATDWVDPATSDRRMLQRKHFSKARTHHFDKHKTGTGPDGRKEMVVY